MQLGRNETTPTRAEALRRLDKARAVRATWKELGRRVHSGEVEPRDVLDHPERYGAERLPVTTFLRYCYGIRWRARDIFLHRARVDRRRRLRSLTPRQRGALAELIENPNVSHVALRPPSRRPKPKSERPSRPNVEQVEAELTEVALANGFESLRQLREQARAHGRARTILVAAMFEARERGATLDALGHAVLQRDNRRTSVLRLLREGEKIVGERREIFRQDAEREPGLMPVLTTPRQMKPRPRRVRSEFVDRR